MGIGFQTPCEEVRRDPQQELWNRDYENAKENLF